MGKKQNTLINDLTRGPLFRQIIAFTLPFMLANLLQTLYTIVDLAIVGHCSQAGALAAVSISGQVTMLLTIVGNMMASGGQIYIAQLVGQKHERDLNDTIGTLVSFALLVSIVCTVFGFIFTPQILKWLNTPTEAFIPAEDYLRICCLGMIFVFGYNAVCAVLRGMGQSKAPTVFVAITAGINIIGDLVLVNVFNMGARGAAIATVGSQAIAFGISLAYLYYVRERMYFDFHADSFRIRKKPLRIIVKLALPLIAMQLVINVSMLYVSSFINAYGVAAASCSGVGNKLLSVFNIVSFAINAAMATIVGQNLGAGNIDRIKKAMYYSLGIDLAFFALVAVIVLVFPVSVFRLFTDDTGVLEISRHYLRIAVWTYLSFSLMNPALGLVSGVGNTMLNLVIAILDSVVARIGLSLLLGVFMGVWGYFWGFSLAGFVSAVMSWAYFYSGRWKSRKLLN